MGCRNELSRFPTRWSEGDINNRQRGGSCADNVLTGGIPGGNVCPVSTSTIFLANGNVQKSDLSFYEVYGKANYTIDSNWQVGVTEFYSPNFLHSGAWGDYASVTGKYTAPGTTFGNSGIGLYVSGEFGRQWLGTTDAFYRIPSFPAGIPYASYNTWNIGLGFTYKVFTLDIRYSTATCRRAIATPSPAPLTLSEQPMLHRSILAVRDRTGAAPPASRSSRSTQLQGAT